MMKAAGMKPWLMVLITLGVLFAGAVWANPEPWQMNMPKGVTPISEKVYAVHMLGLYVCAGIGIVVYVAMIIALFRFRQSRGVVPAKWSHHSLLETVWTIIPVILLAILAVPATTLLVEMADTTESEMTVKITGYQWKWRYDYVDYQDRPVDKVGFISSLDRESDRARQLGSGIDPWEIRDDEGFRSYLLNVDKPLVLPTDTKIRLMITAEDVIHSWWVPDIGFKVDAIPGTVNTAWTQIHTPGTYRGQCAELCGQDHGFMPVVIKAVPRAEFETWLATQQNEARLERASRTAQAESVNLAPRG